ncbi:MAG: rhomboid family intramembrane serine protease [Proteobacteria bacterium]|nr:rhomboid family intramembrane serine protease [Pseudomonadota bacterium]NIS59233.1 rhomboid family intramembrane serine protease [Pseudomonadota bacterium]
MILPVGTNLKLKRTPWATIGLMAANMLVFIHQIVLEGNGIYGFEDYFLFVPGDRCPWQWVTAMFFHANLLHLLGNFLFLWVFGIYVEDRVGRRDYLFLYFMTGMAATFVHGIMKGLFQPESLFTPCLGASGAISGIMGVYIYRLYYSKVKLVITPFCFFIPKRIPVNAVAVLGYWFSQDVMGGVASLRNPYLGVAFWAHVGGFLMGVMACWLLKYGREAVREKNRFVGEQYLEKPYGFGKGIEALEKALVFEPKNPYLHVSLARAKSRLRNTRSAGEHYEKAIRLLIRRDPKEAAEIYREYWGKYLAVFEPEMQLALNRLLIRQGYFDFSAKTLEVLIHDHRGEDPYLEKAFLMLARLYGQQLKRPEKAASVYEDFLRNFPNSPWRRIAQKEYEEVTKEWNGWRENATEDGVGMVHSSA